MSGVTSGISAAVAGATVPQPVREEGADAVRGFRAALQFESMLLKQMLAEALPESPTGSGGTGSGEEEGFGGGEGGSFTATPTPVSLPETVAEAIAAGGGLGVAQQMYTSFEGAGS
jgi:Rod binding domain-containing protein